MTPEERSDKLLALVERIAVALEALALVGKLPAPSKPSVQPAKAVVDYITPIPDCPKCGQPMLLRTAKTSGKQFWGCRTFPDCDGARGEDGTPWTKRGGSGGRRSRSGGYGGGPQGEAAQDAYERDLGHEDVGSEAF